MLCCLVIAGGNMTSASSDALDLAEDHVEDAVENAVEGKWPEVVGCVFAALLANSGTGTIVATAGDAETTRITRYLVANTATARLRDA